MNNSDRHQPEKREKCSRCHLPASFVDGAVIKKADVLFFVCRFCAIHEHKHVQYFNCDFYNRYGNLLQQ